MEYPSLSSLYTLYVLEHYDNSGIRKALLLTRYVNLVRQWLRAERQTPVVVDAKSDDVRTIDFQ